MKRNALQLLTACMLLALAGAGAHAQVYRIVGPDGRITYSDKAPVEGAKAAPTTAGGNPDAAASLPFALRTIANRYPVTLYTSASCGPCGSGRALLTSRGIPFSERTVSTNEDQDALQRLSGDLTVPFLTIGGQQIKGYSDVEWSQFLDAAGYPKTSQLPAAYRQPPASPLVAVQKPAAPGTGGNADGSNTAQRPVNPAPTAPRPSADNPAGITF